MAAAADISATSFDGIFGTRRSSRPFGDSDVHERNIDLDDRAKLLRAFADIRRAGVCARILHNQSQRDRFAPDRAYVFPNALLGSGQLHFDDNDRLKATLHLTYRAGSDQDKWTDLDVAAIACRALRANGLACDTPTDDGDSIVIDPARQLSALTR